MENAQIKTGLTATLTSLWKWIMPTLATKLTVFFLVIVFKLYSDGPNL